MKQLLSLLLLMVLYFSCKKDSSQNSLAGEWEWTIQYADNPFYNSTPQSSGIHETLSFSNNGDYTVMQNGITVNSGTYVLITGKNLAGENIPGIKYTNTRITDSTDYYMLTNNNDSLFFSHDLIGTVGSGSRHYGKK